MRARVPDEVGVVSSHGVDIGYEVFGTGEPAIVFMPSWTIVHTRFWKMQVPYFARHHRVITYDGPGNGRSARTTSVDPYRVPAQADHALAVMDATGTERAVLVSLSKGALWSLHLAANVPERVLGQVFIGPTLPLVPPSRARARIADRFHQTLDSHDGWDKYNVAYWRTDLPDFAEFFFSECFPEAHSTKPREDCVGWAGETSAEMLVADAATDRYDPDDVLALCDRVRTPVLVIHGDNDRISPVSCGEELSKATGGAFVVLAGSGHIPLARDPVKVNLLIHEFLRSSI